jgi:hypothetical protein
MDLGRMLTNSLKVDVKIDWKKKTLSLFINSTFKGFTDFYDADIQNVDQILLYNLNPNTVSYWKNLELCKI